VKRAALSTLYNTFAQVFTVNEMIKKIKDATALHDKIEEKARQ